MFISSLCSTFVNALVNVLAIIGIIVAGGFVVFFLGDLLLSVLDPKHNKKKEEKIKELFKQKYNIDNTDITNNDILSQIDSNITNKICFEISQSALTEMGLMDIAQSLSDEERQNYIMVYDVNDCTNLDIVCIEGIPYDGVSYYSLSCLQNKFREE